jgi:predicted lipoprotein with Yx(FWY)xxD motif
MRKGVRATCVLATSLGLLVTGCGAKHKAVPSSGGFAQPTVGPETSPPSTAMPESSPPSTAAPESSPPLSSAQPSAGPVELKAKDVNGLGKILVDGKDMTVYLFDKDKGGKPACTGECEKQWPPLITTETPTAGEGVNASWLASVDRPDGTKQVTYHGWPLYHFVKDTKPGDTNGQGMSAFGGKWYAVSADKGDKAEKR